MPDSERLNAMRSLWKNTGSERPAFAIPPLEGQESVWDYPRPPAIVPDDREVVVRYQGVELVRTTHAVRICETASPPTFYLPREDVNVDFLHQMEGSSYCEWKGQATYWSVALPDQPVLRNVAWSYESPYPEYETLKGHFSFYPAQVECMVAEHVVEPQPGGFYGGWVTPEIVGPFKGDPGTGGW